MVNRFDDAINALLKLQKKSKWSDEALVKRILLALRPYPVTVDALVAELQKQPKVLT